MTKTNKIFEECFAKVDPKIKAEVRARADAYIGHPQEVDNKVMAETIEERAKEYEQKKHCSYAPLLGDAYYDGATEQESITKKEMVEKACEWLRANLWNYYIASSQADNCGIDDENLLEDFRKAMEE